MKKILRTVTALACAAVLLGLAGCTGRSTLLREADSARPLSYSERDNADLTAVAAGERAFAARFSAAMYAQAGQNEQFVLSPVSVYAGLSLAAACAAGETKAQLLSALGVTEGQLSAGFAPYYRSLMADGKDDKGKQRTRLQLANAIYVNEGTQVNEACLGTLASDYFCHSYSADFLNDNQAANRAVTAFVKEQTNGLIDADFGISEDTAFTLINALYLKDVWNEYGNDLPSAGDMVFSDVSGNGTTVPFLRGYYETGRPYEGSAFTSFFAETFAGYRIHFLLPDEGRTADEVFTAEVLTELLTSADYRAVDEENKIRYYTRCLFPAFGGGCDENAAAVLQETFGVRDLFSPRKSDLTALTGDGAYCSEVRHIAKLTVDEKGIEGAAATVLPAAGAPGPDGYEEVHLDFAVDRAFGFVLTDRYGAVLFTGVIRSL